MADDRMALLELAEKHADGDMPREPGQYVPRRLMELEAQQRCGAGPHERSAERVNQRDGYRELVDRCTSSSLPVRVSRRARQSSPVSNRQYMRR